MNQSKFPKSLLIFLLFFCSITNAQNNVTRLKFSIDSKFFIKASGSKLTIYNTENPEESVKFQASNSRINDISIDETNSVVYSAGKNGVVDSWTLRGEHIKPFGKTIYSINCIEIIEKEGLLIGGDGAGYMYVWDANSGDLITDLKVHAGGISDLFYKNGFIYSSSFVGSICKTAFNKTKNSLESITLFSDADMEIYDLVESPNDKAVFSYLTTSKKETTMHIATFDLTEGKLVSKVSTSFKLEKYESRIYLTTLGLQRYDKSLNIFTLYNSNTLYNISDKGKIHTTENEFFNEENTPMDLSDLYYPEIENTFAISPNKNYAFFIDESSEILFNLSDSTEYGTFMNIPFKGNYLEQKYSENLAIVYPNSLFKDLVLFSTQKEKETGDVTPIVQSRFIYYQDRIYNQDSTLIATTNESNFIKVFDIQKKKLVVNLFYPKMAMRIIRHPSMPIFASLHIDGIINIWSFENFQLIKSYKLLDKKSARKVLQKNKNYFESSENMPLLQMHRYFANQVDDNPLSFRFSPLGDEIWIFMPGSIYNNTKALNFNSINLINDKKLTFNTLNDINWDSYGQNLPLETKGDWSLLQTKYWDDFQFYYPRFNSIEKNDRKIDSILGAATKEMGIIVPNLFQSNYGKYLILDYGDFLTSIDLKDLSVKTIAIHQLPHKYQKYTSNIEFEKRNISVSDSTAKAIFWIKRYIDTAFAYTFEVPNGYGIENIDEIDPNDFDGRERLSYGANEKYSRYFSYDYYLWDIENQSIIEIDKEKFEEIKNSSSFFIEERDCPKIDDDWTQFMNEMTAMEAEQKAAQYDKSIRGYGGYSSSTSSSSLSCEVHSVIMGNKIIGIKNSDNKFINKVGPQSSAVIDQEFLMNSEFFLTNNLNGEIMVWDWKNSNGEAPLVKFVGSGSELFAITPDNYYMAISSGAKGMAFRKDGLIFEFEQFDLKCNRPDIILDRLGFADSSLISGYNTAYQKRLKKMGFTEDMLEDDFHLPEIKIENYEDMPTIHDQGSIDLKLKFEDTKYKLDRINVWVNDVAIYGTNGISLRDKNIQDYTTSLSVDLAKGKNKVQLSVLNQAGAESYKETFEIQCSVGKTTPDLYLITIGVSEYEQTDFNLTYAAKDAHDMSALFQKSKAYKNIFSKTLINRKVTKENVLALKTFLADAGINDEVMIFIAGHGVLDANLDYYLATFDMNFQQPQNRGLAYNDLESILDGIKPLKKTLIIDACHSGEIDKEEIELAQADTQEGQEIQFRAVGNSVAPKLGIQNTSELVKSLFTDLRKGSGATVISSAGGMEFAIESDDWNNGLFTYCFMKGIQSKAADLNKDGEIWLSEIQQYVSEQVYELSGGRQQPTSRIENQTIDFRVW